MNTHGQQSGRAEEGLVDLGFGDRVVREPSIRLINRDGTSVWLDVSFDQVVERLPRDGRRPLAADRASMQALYDARRSAYASAHLRLDASHTPVGELVEHILDWLMA